MKKLIWVIGLFLGIIIPYILTETIFIVYNISTLLQVIIITIIHGIIAFIAIRVYHLIHDK